MNPIKGGYSGFFLAGAYSYWVIAGEGGRLRVHTMWQDGLINCFTQFHNENCPNGFLYFCHSSKTLSVSLLDHCFDYDSDLPTRKIKLNYTPHYSSYDVEQKVVTVAGSREEQIDLLPKVI
jgi:cleavage and polyadenylation specificity factor subunit 1